MSQQFWGITLEPKSIRKVAVAPFHVLHITHAAIERPLDSDDVTGRVAIKCRSGRSPLKFIVCTLSDAQDQCSLNLMFSQSAKSATASKDQKNPKFQNPQSGRGRYSKKGRAKRRQPDLTEPLVTQKGVKRKAARDSDGEAEEPEKRREKAAQAVAEFYHHGSLAYPVHLTGFIENVNPKSAFASTLEQMQLANLEEALRDSEDDQEENQEKKDNENVNSVNKNETAEEDDEEDEEEGDEEKKEEPKKKENVEKKTSKSASKNKRLKKAQKSQIKKKNQKNQ